jgi:hypothetical protein
VPVSLLLSEGGGNSPDVRVLSKLLSGRCQVRPDGGKYGMGTRIIARRESIGREEVFGVLDRDFVKAWAPLLHEPIEWRGPDGTLLGWRWERKEIENYLIDPAVVELALNRPHQIISIIGYRSALETARDQLHIYQAARTALATSRVRFQDLASSFGRKHGRERHLFPDDLDDANCRDGMRQAVGSHRQAQVVEFATVEAAFEALRLDFQVGAPRYASYLHAFAGKDLLWHMDNSLRGFGFAGSWAFREQVVIGIQRTRDDIGTWLPEWRALQQAIDNL